MGDAYAPGLNSAPTIGAALRAVREFHGLDLEDLAQSTRIRKSYLAAIEDMRLEDLPSRPFVVGYVRAYALALRLDPEAAAARFREDAPDDDQGLRAPVGVRRERDPKLTLFIVAGLIVVIAVALWNIAQHSMTADAPAHAAAPEIAQSAPLDGGKPAEAASAQGALPLGAPLPAPAESTTPRPYVTPGLESSTGAAPPDSSATTAAPPDDASATPTPFVAKGAVYGAPAGRGVAIVQASRSGSLVIHGADGAVYFARELAAGEAYRIPAVAGLSVDVSDPQAFNYFVGGMLKGPLPAAQTPVSQLTE